LSNRSGFAVIDADKALIAAIGLCLALQASLALVMEINWDEFFYLSNLYSYQHGELAKPLQSFHIHLLGWLTSLPGNEIDQIVAGRFVMLLCEAGTCALIYLLARRFASRTAALAAALAFVSASFTIIHGASFRADLGRAAPVVTVVLALAVAVVTMGGRGVVALLLAAVGALAFAAFMSRRLGGVSGDVHGAVIELSELVVLLTAAAR